MDIYCNVPLNYLNEVGGSEMGPVPVNVDIRNGRTEADAPGWQERGFELIEHRSAAEWDDPESISNCHYAEMEELAKAMTGADAALVGGHILRNPEEMQRHADLGPIHFVHSDFAESYEALIRDRYQQDEEFFPALRRAGITADDVAGAKRLLILQFWRNLGAPVMDEPIAFCDCNTVCEEQLARLPVENYASSGFNFDTLGIRAPKNPADNHWTTFPAMEQGEAVALRTFDTDMIETGGHFWTPHSAFRDPNVGADAPRRSSIELRATCLFF